MSRIVGCRLVQGTLLRQGLLFGRASSDSTGTRTAQGELQGRAASTWQLTASDSHASDGQDSARATRHIHYAAEHSAIANANNEFKSTSTVSQEAVEQSRQHAVEQSRFAGGGITWAELFLMKRKRLMESP